jgi:hypothetical protein
MRLAAHIDVLVLLRCPKALPLIPLRFASQYLEVQDFTLVDDREIAFLSAPGRYYSIAAPIVLLCVYTQTSWPVTLAI